MIKRRLLVILLSLIAGWICAEGPAVCDSAAVAPPQRSEGQKTSACPEQGETCGCCPWCVNDYCRKPAPPIPPATCQWCCPVYCRKPMPMTGTPCQWCPDDYCGKPAPPVPHNCEPWYRCVPTNPLLP